VGRNVGPRASFWSSLAAVSFGEFARGSGGELVGRHRQVRLSGQRGFHLSGGNKSVIRLAEALLEGRPILLAE